jgi:AraC-like DNA-binding protein
MKENKIHQKAVEYILAITDNEIKNLTANDVAAAINKNIFLLSKTFKKVQKISLSEFIKREKIQRAFYILNTDRKISIIDLSERLGFAAPGQFEKEFQDYFCINPGDYQKIRKKTNNQVFTIALR